jgi:ferredoxin
MRILEPSHVNIDEDFKFTLRSVLYYTLFKDEVTLMCQFCARHGAGKKWFLNERNLNVQLAKEMGFEKWEVDHWRLLDKVYAELAGQVANLIGDPKGLAMVIKVIEELVQKDKGPRKFPEGHMGQVITLEEAKDICRVAGDVYRIMCPCRFMNRNEKVYTCMPLGLHGETVKSFSDRSPKGVEQLTVEEAGDFLEKCDQQGMVHTIAGTPLPIAFAMCNCEYPECMALRPRIEFNVHHLLKGHYVANVDIDKCIGCGNCATHCQFGAMSLRPALGRAYVNQFKCFGCGLCRANCEQNAITLIPKESIPTLREEW